MYKWMYGCVDPEQIQDFGMRSFSADFQDVPPTI